MALAISSPCTFSACNGVSLALIPSPARNNTFAGSSNGLRSNQLSLSFNPQPAGRQSRGANLVVRAATLPPGAKLPPVQPKLPENKYGFTRAAEQMNSRAAMMGLIGLFLVEAVFGKGILELFGVTVGKGLNINF